MCFENFLCWCKHTNPRRKNRTKKILDDDYHFSYSTIYDAIKSNQQNIDSATFFSLSLSIFATQTTLMYIFQQLIQNGKLIWESGTVSQGMRCITTAWDIFNSNNTCFLPNQEKNIYDKASKKFTWLQWAKMKKLLCYQAFTEVCFNICCEISFFITCVSFAFRISKE